VGKRRNGKGGKKEGEGRRRGMELMGM